MKILKVWPFWQEEIKYHDHYLADEMSKKGIDTTFLVPDKIPKSLYPFLNKTHVVSGESYYNNSKVIRLKSIDFMGKFIITDFRKMYKIVNNEYDIIHIFGISNIITFMTLFILFFHKKRPLIVINDHNHPADDKKTFVAKSYYMIFKVLYKLFSSRITKIIVPNQASFNYIKHRYSIKDNDKLNIVPLGYDNNIFNYTNKKNFDTKLVIGYAGKIVPQKEIEKLLTVLADLNYNDIDCLIVGFSKDELSSYQKGLIKLAEKLKLKNVEFRPFIDSPGKLSEFYNYIDVAVFPGSISITTLEANGCGTPIILYKSINGLNDRVEDVRGELFETGDELRILISNYIQMKRDNKIDNKKIELISSKYSWTNLANIYITMYKNLLNMDMK